GSAPQQPGGRPSPSSCHSRGEESFAVKDLAFAEQVIYSSTQTSGQRAQGARLAVLLLAASQPLFGLLALAEAQAASEQAHFRWALPILLPPVPCFLPAGSCVQRTSRASERNGPTSVKRRML